MKLDLEVTTVDGASKHKTIYADEVMGLMDVIMSMMSSRRDAPVCLTITRTDIIKKFLSEKKS